MRIEFYNTKDYDLDLHMITCGYEDSPPNFVCAPHFRGYYLIHYVSEGKGVYEVNGVTYPVCRGDIFIIYPGEPVAYSCPDPDHPWSLYWLGFSGSSAEHFFRAAGLFGYVKTLKKSAFATVIAECLSYVKENEGNLSMLRLSAFVLDALDALSGESKSRRLSPAERVEQALRYIEYHYMNAISPKDVADHLSLERSYFYRIFRKHTGTSPEQYIIRFRMQKAADLIRLGRYSFTEIASFVGTGDIFYFSRLFKKIHGISPREYAASLPLPSHDVPREDSSSQGEQTVILV